MDKNFNDPAEESLFTKNVRSLAHYLYVLRGCPEGRTLVHWIEAETQLRDYHSLVQPSLEAQT